MCAKKLLKVGPALCIVTRGIIYFVIAVIVVATLPGIPPNISLESYKVTPSMKLEGDLKPRYVLDKAVKIIDGELNGAESIVVNGNTLYTATTDGKIIKIQDDDGNGNYGKENAIEIITSFGKPCQGNKNKICTPGIGGGIRFNSEGHLLVVDAAHGIALIDPENGKTNYIITTESEVTNDDKKSTVKLPDDLDITKDGIIYYSDFSTEFSIYEFSMERFGDSAGRLIRFDPKTKTNSVVLSNLQGANGVQLSQNEEFVLVVETAASRVSRLYLKGPKAGTSDIFVDGLPGLPDNIRPNPNGKGGFYIILVFPRVAIVDALSEYPFLRKCLFRLGWLSRLPLKLIRSFGFQNTHLNELEHYIANYGPFGMDLDATPVIIDIDAHGKILRTLAASKNEMQMATQLTVGSKFAYLGGIWSQQVWKIDVNDLNGN